MNGIRFAFNLFARFIVRDLMKNRVRSVITVLGIALGVSVLLAISLANNTVIAKFKETVDQVSGKANLEIRPKTVSGLDEKLIAKLDWLPILGGKYTPLINQNVVFPGESDELVQFLGIDMLADPEFKTYGEKESAEEEGKRDSSTKSKASSGGSSLDILEPRAVFVGSKLAFKHGLHTGQIVDLLINDSLQHFKLAGILSGKGLGGAYSGNLIVCDIGLAQEALNMPGKVSQIEVIVPPDDVVAVQEKLAAELPDSVSVMRPSQRGEQVEKITKSFEYNLLALAFVALMVGMFLIYNTMSITILRRRQEIGTLRALGVTAGQIFAMFSLEALFFGITGTLLGIGGGLLLANGALTAIAKTVQHFYFQDPIETVIFNPLILGASLFGGIGLTYLASLPPLLEAISVPPAEATRRGSQELRVFNQSGRFALLGLLLFVAAYLASLQQPIDHFPVFGYVAALCSILGSAFFLPLILKIFLPIAALLFARASISEGRLAALSLYGTLGRTSVAVASLMIGIAMMVSLAIMIGSFRRTVTTWVDQTLKADLWAESAAHSSGSSGARMSDFVVKEMEQTEEVAAVDAFVETPIQFRGDQTNLAAGDFAVIEKFGHMHFTDGESCAEVCRRVRGKSAIVSETFAIRKNIKKGDSLELETPHGPLQLKVEDIYYDYASDLGFIVIDRPVYRQFFDDNDISSTAIYLMPNADPATVRSRILKKVASKSLLSIRTTRELREEAMKVFDRTFSITYALHTIAIAVAMLAVMNALFALTIESKREFGILRYLGAREGQLTKLVLYEAGFLGIFGNLSGLFLGCILAVLLIYVINKQSFGWTIELSVPFDFLLESSTLVILTAVISGILPARIAAKTVAPQVVRDE
jgi:putative ABC transport system permease protein